MLLAGDVVGIDSPPPITQEGSDFDRCFSTCFSKARRLPNWFDYQ
ncbi:hypothetical protein [Limnospira indica]|uniref:Uncharacterized protein n=1 Tax=Limnospira indica PCC 8005 TaxID=376219 RepID=A0A9P1KFC6_9CYAN|nr:hypothetical protein [Limnospira indica]CDM94688.1 conserved protein of unknown function [Limnospira indica PCC 8005]